MPASLTDTRSQELFARAKQSLVGGVNSPVRAMRGIGRDPIFIDRAEGTHVFDVDGNAYVDYLASWGPAILGHAPPVVIDDLRDALARGTSYGAPTEREIVFAEAIRDAMPSIERLRMTSSGSEAVMGAVRLARAATGREVIVKTEGGYHGAIDGLLAQAGSGATTLGVPTSPGVTAGATAATRLVPYNDLAAAEVAPSASSSSPSPATWAWCLPRRAILRASAPPATAPAHCLFSTRSSPDSGWPAVGPRSASV